MRQASRDHEHVNALRGKYALEREQVHAETETAIQGRLKELHAYADGASPVPRGSLTATEQELVEAIKTAKRSAIKALERGLNETLKRGEAPMKLNPELDAEGNFKAGSANEKALKSTLERLHKELGCKSPQTCGEAIERINSEKLDLMKSCENHSLCIGARRTLLAALKLAPTLIAGAIGFEILKGIASELKGCYVTKLLGVKDSDDPTSKLMKQGKLSCGDVSKEEHAEAVKDACHCPPPDGTCASKWKLKSLCPEASCENRCSGGVAGGAAGREEYWIYRWDEPSWWDVLKWLGYGVAVTLPQGIGHGLGKALELLGTLGPVLASVLFALVVLWWLVER